MPSRSRFGRVSLHAMLDDDDTLGGQNEHAALGIDTELTGDSLCAALRPVQCTKSQP